MFMLGAAATEKKKKKKTASLKLTAKLPGISSLIARLSVIKLLKASGSICTSQRF